jgi:signal peptidase I
MQNIHIPGDRIHLRGGIVYRNGVSLDEPYAAKPTPANYDPYNDEFPAISPAKGRGVTAEWSLDLPDHIQGEDLVVPSGMYFVMGDNRTRDWRPRVKTKGRSSQRWAANCWASSGP